MENTKVISLSNVRRTPFMLPAETKIILFLVFFAASVSLTRTHTMLRIYAAPEGIRSLTLEQPKGTENVQTINVTSRRVIVLEALNDWNTTIYYNTMIRKYSTIKIGNVYMDGDIDSEVVDIKNRNIQTDSSGDTTLERSSWPSHEFDPYCQPAASWQSTFHPTCNDIHGGIDIRQAFVDGSFSLLSRKGFWRNTWLYTKHDSALNSQLSATIPASKIVWKTQKFLHRYEELFYENSRVDAVAMERLTASPYVIDIYGFCGLTVVQEYGCKDLSQVLATNAVTSTSKLQLAKQISEGVYHIHSIQDDDDGFIPSNTFFKNLTKVTLVHNDINVANLLFTADNVPKINDFNIAKFLMRHNATGEMCPFYSHFPNPQWKAPEEQVLYNLDGTTQHGMMLPIVNEKVDIYALGNIYYRILTGTTPWRRPKQDRLDIHDKAEVARLKKYYGMIPPIPNETLRIIQIDPVLQTLYDVMQSCYRWNASERPTAAELVYSLDKALTINGIAIK